MADEGVGRGIFVSTGTYPPDALQFGAVNPIQLLDFAFEGDYRTPTCASCGTRMVARDSKRGAFWGCAHYPRCRTTLAMRA